MEDHIQEQAPWNILAMLAFIIAFLGSVLLLGPQNIHSLYQLQFFDFIILGGATFRLIRLVTFDKIFAFVRHLFLDREGSEWQKPSRGFRRLVAELIECIWCTGLWAALAVTTLYVLSPLGYFFVLILAVSSLGALLQNASKKLASS